MKKIIKIISISLLLLFLNFLNLVNANEKIKIGLLVPMSGANKEIGESIIKAVGLAVKDIDNNLIVAPADGKIIELEETIPDEQIGLPKGKYFKIGIFMNVFNVHVNRSPMSGTIIKKNYVPGLFFNASLDKASKENERMSLIMNVNGKVKIAFVQIAGLLARRIVNEAQEGDKLKTGEVFGIIRFGSKVDIYIPVGSKINVLKGQTSIAGETMLAELPSKKNKL